MIRSQGIRPQRTDDATLLALRMREAKFKRAVEKAG